MVSTRRRFLNEIVYFCQGRGGKGAIYTWASGNGGLDDDCNADGYSNSQYTIAVGAVSETTSYTWYSENCAAILAATYSGDSPNEQIVCVHKWFIYSLFLFVRPISYDFLRSFVSCIRAVENKLINLGVILTAKIRKRCICM